MGLSYEKFYTQSYGNLELEHLRMQHVLKWNHLEEVGIGNLWLGVLLVDDRKPHNDGHYSGQEHENDYENDGKSNMATNFSCGNRNNRTGDDRVRQHTEDYEHITI
jgi:hypothetical protein